MKILVTTYIVFWITRWNLSKGHISDNCTGLYMYIVLLSNFVYYLYLMCVLLLVLQFPGSTKRRIKLCEVQAGCCQL